MKRVNFVQEFILGLFSLLTESVIDSTVCSCFVLFAVATSGDLFLGLNRLNVVHVHWCLVHEVGSLGTEAHWMPGIPTSVICLVRVCCRWLLCNWLILLLILLLRLCRCSTVWIVMRNNFLLVQILSVAIVSRGSLDPSVYPFLTTVISSLNVLSIPDMVI